jgi:5-methylcytosine-specific restriction endonuclease McrA
MVCWQARTKAFRKIKREVFDRDGRVCRYCKTPLRFYKDPFKNGLPPPDLATVDHIIPVSTGGKSEAWNLVPACHRCNTERSSMPYIKYLELSRERAGSAALATAEATCDSMCLAEPRDGAARSS